VGGMRHSQVPHEKTLKWGHDGNVSDPLPLFPVVPVPNRSPQGGAIKAVPQAALATPELTAGILLSIQQERQQL
jgi:hypothetical protein